MRKFVFSWPTFPARALVLGALVFTAFNLAFGDSFQDSYLPAGVQTPLGITTHYTTFNKIAPGTATGTPYTSTFQGSGITGNYTGGIDWFAANQYGGAGGTGTYAETFSSYTLSLSRSVNYFGLWFSALDSGNQLQFYSDDTLLYTFLPGDFINLVGACPGSNFCGNPDPQFLGEDDAEQFAYLNFYDADGLFNKVVFTQFGIGGFESDNQAIGVFPIPPGGTPIGTVPEPATLSIMFLGSGLLTLGRVRRGGR